MSNTVYVPRGIGARQPFINENPVPIVSTRAPLTTDRAQIGQMWINSTTNTVYTLTSITSGASIWTSNYPQTATAASPTAQVTMNARVGVATFTGFTTADGGGQQDFTIINSYVKTTSAVLVSVANLNASANGAALTWATTQSNGDLFVLVTNNGLGALGAGDNVLITFWVLS